MLLSMPLPLRTTAVWGEFGEIQPLPWAYGRCDVVPVVYTQDRTQWLVADHAIAGVDGVRVGDADATFVWRNAADSSGHAVALVELATAPESGAAISVALRGALHPRTGVLLENPADIAWDMLTRSGIVTTESEWMAFRRQCTNAGLVCAGVFDEIVTVRSALDDLLSSVGAVWSAGARGWARLWPSN